MTWDEYHGAEEWLMDDLTKSHCHLAEVLTQNESFMKVAAHCIAADELWGSEKQQRIDELLGNPQERQSAALFLLYRGASNLREAENLLAELRNRQREIIEMNLKQQEKENDMQQEKQVITYFSTALATASKAI